VFVATGPVVGIALFLIIMAISLALRTILKKLRMRLQYLPRMAFLLWAVCFSVLGILFLAPIVKYPDVTNVSIFPVLFLALLSEDFSRVQLGKSISVAVSLTSETLILALVSYLFLTFYPLQKFALLNPEALLALVLVFDFLVGKYVGLRFLEFFRFRRLIQN
jgi:hypothetical protein